LKLAAGSVQKALAAEKQKHILKLKMLENPQLAAQVAAEAAAPKATAQPPKAATPGAPGAGKPAAAAAKGGGDSGGSGMFDDVGDDYEVDTSAVKKKQASRTAENVRAHSLPTQFPACIMLLHRHVARGTCLFWDLQHRISWALCTVGDELCSTML
jgi:hypothetical protein